jgi:hypothetical protein
LNDLNRDGFAIVSGVVDRNRIPALRAHLEAATDQTAVRARKSTTYAVRNLLSLVPEVRELSRSPAMLALVEPVLGPGARAVRGLLFDKTPGANWKVAWHQDLSIAVKGRVEVSGFGPWSEKAGVLHVQPPPDVLRNMLTVRLHLDDCPAENGPLQVLAGSHAHGIIPPESIAELRKTGPLVTCLVKAGGAVLMRPLTLHASPTSTTPGHRRVIHIEYAAANTLPAGIQWHESDENKDP